MAQLEGEKRAAVCRQARAYLQFTPFNSAGREIWDAAKDHGYDARLTALAFRIACVFQRKWRRQP